MGRGERKGILEFMKNCLNDCNYNIIISDNKRVMALIKKLFEFLPLHYTFRDIENRKKKRGSHHHIRFDLLYIDKSNMSLFEVAHETHVQFESGALKKHVKEYNDVNLQYIKDESVFNADYAILLNEYLKSGL